MYLSMFDKSNRPLARIIFIARLHFNYYLVLMVMKKTNVFFIKRRYINLLVLQLPTYKTP